MRSQTGCPDEASVGGRVLWLGQVSKAATMLAGTRVPKEFENIPAVSERSTAPIAIARPIVLSVRREDSFNPAVRPTKSHLRSNSTLAIVTGLIIIMAMAVATFFLMGEPSRIDIRPWMTNDGLTKFFSLRTARDPVAAIPAEQTSPSLIIQPSRGTSNEPVLLGLAVHGPAEEAVVYIGGLVPGMELSTGRAVGADSWEIAATDLGYAWIAPPPGFVGSAKLVAELRLPNNKIADRQAIHVGWGTSSPAIALTGRRSDPTPSR